jgi:hypothetical protein
LEVHSFAGENEIVSTQDQNMNKSLTTKHPIPTTNRIETNASYALKAVLTLAMVYAFVQGNHFITFSAIMALIASSSPALISRHWRLVLPVELDLILTCFIAMHLIFGEIGGFYLKYWWFDLLLHKFSGIVLGYVGFMWGYMLFYTNKIQAQPWFILVFTVSLAMAGAAIWEIFEFSMDNFFGFNMQKSDLQDTMTDMIACLAGSLFFGIFGYVYIKKYKVGLIRNMIIWRDRQHS